jgi:hypothetical protein
MAPEETNPPEKPEIVIDDDWKARVKAEDAALDEKQRSETADETESDETETTADEPQQARITPEELPPADFATLVSMLMTQVMVALGAIPNPASGKPEKEPVLAKHFIDLLSILDEKTKGNLAQDEAAMLETTLHQLRLAYIEITK